MSAFFKPLIAMWPDVPTFAAEVGCPRNNANEWVRIDSIPAPWFAAVVRAAGARAFDEITAELLAERAEQRRLAKEAARPSGDNRSQAAA